MYKSSYILPYMVRYAFNYISILVIFIIHTKLLKKKTTSEKPG